MLTQSKTACPACEDCPMFNAYPDDTRSRGLCKLFDKVTRGYHEMTNDCRNNMDEVTIILHSTWTEVDPEDGTIEPKSVEELTVFLPHNDVSHELVLQTFRQYADNFSGFSLFEWIWPNNPAHEF